MISSPRRAIAAVAAVVAFVFLWLSFGSDSSRKHDGTVLNNHGNSDTTTHGRQPFGPGVAKPPGSNYTRTLVVPKLKSESIAWITQELPDLATAIYHVDDPSGPFQVPQNKGHEAMVYLTYIIDHYDALPDSILFFHAHRVAWHNNILLGLDSANTIRRMRDDRIARVGYMNSRCHLDPGCPDWIHLDRPEVDFDIVKKPEEKQFSFELWNELFPGHRAPPVLSQPCCAQFAVSRERVRDNPKGFYEHLRRWLLETPLEDSDSGRIFEYMWQYIFTRNPEHCPAPHSCYCDGYGICFGSATKLDDWLKKLRTREIAEDELRQAEEDGRDSSAISQIQDTISNLGRELEAEKAEAYKRGDDERNRAIERERAPKSA